MHENIIIDVPWEVIAKIWIKFKPSINLICNSVFNFTNHQIKVPQKEISDEKKLIRSYCTSPWKYNIAALLQQISECFVLNYQKEWYSTDLLVKKKKICWNFVTNCFLTLHINFLLLNLIYFAHLLRPSIIFRFWFMTGLYLKQIVFIISSLTGWNNWIIKSTDLCVRAIYFLCTDGSRVSTLLQNCKWKFSHYVNISAEDKTWIQH